MHFLYVISRRTFCCAVDLSVEIIILVEILLNLAISPNLIILQDLSETRAMA
jgi:hypothetical protein